MATPHRAPVPASRVRAALRNASSSAAAEPCPSSGRRLSVSGRIDQSVASISAALTCVPPTSRAGTRSAPMRCSYRTKRSSLELIEQTGHQRVGEDDRVAGGHVLRLVALPARRGGGGERGQPDPALE